MFVGHYGVSAPNVGEGRRPHRPGGLFRLRWKHQPPRDAAIWHAWRGWFDRHPGVGGGNMLSSARHGTAPPGAGEGIEPCDIGHGSGRCVPVVSAAGGDHGREPASALVMEEARGRLNRCPRRNSGSFRRHALPLGAQDMQADRRGLHRGLPSRCPPGGRQPRSRAARAPVRHMFGLGVMGVSRLQNTRRS
jgi:hypothetical protein